MVFNVYSPAKNLQPFIKAYLEADSRESKQIGIHNLFPNGYSGIFFNSGNLGKISIKAEYETPHVSIFGQIDQCFEAIHSPGSYSLGVMFEPTFLSKWLRVNMAEFTNKVFSGELIRYDLTSLHEKLEEAISVKNKIELLDQFFLGATKDLPKVPTLAEVALQMIHQFGNVAIGKIANDLKVSERYLETQFKKSVGLSPKTYSMIVRFNRMERQINAMPTKHWNQMDFGSEYYDQNHFIKDFKRFTGHTPSEYLLKNFEMGRSYLVR